MASIYKRKNDDGTTVWRAVVRIKGYPTVCNHFERKQEAEDWAQGVERQIKAGQFQFDQHNQIRTFAELTNRYTQDGALEHHRSGDDTKRHLAYWKTRLGAYALVHITPELKLPKRRSFEIARFYEPVRQNLLHPASLITLYSAIDSHPIFDVKYVKFSGGK